MRTFTAFVYVALVSRSKCTQLMAIAEGWSQLLAIVCSRPHIVDLFLCKTLHIAAIGTQYMCLPEASSISLCRDPRAWEAGQQWGVGVQTTPERGRREAVGGVMHLAT